MDFYGYNSQEEAEKYWTLPDKSTWSIESVSTYTRGKNCTGCFPVGVYHYDDGTTDGGETAQYATMILRNNRNGEDCKIKFEV